MDGMRVSFYFGCGMAWQFEMDGGRGLVGGVGGQGSGVLPAVQ